MVVAYGEFVDFVAAGTTPQGVVDFHPTEATKGRVADLIRREKTTGLTHEEKSELDHSMHVEHLMRLAKAKARQHLSNAC